MFRVLHDNNVIEQSNSRRRWPVGVLLGTCLSLGLLGCRSESPKASAEAPKQVVLYCSVDAPFARQILESFTQRTGIRVLPLFDTEADKTTGLARRIRAERANPQADVFWSSEPFQTIALAEDGLLEAFLPETAKDIPLAYRDAKDRWVGFAVRARVLAYDPQAPPAQQPPKTWQQLAQPPWASKVVFANPLFGTTRGHIAAMLQIWGEEKFTQWVDAMAAAGLPRRLAAGNAHAAKKVALGQVALAATDTDDVFVLQANGAKIGMIYPDMGLGGTLLIPNTVAVLKNAPHPQAARKLAAFLCSEFVEEALAKSRSGNIPVRPALRSKLGLSLPPASPVDYVQVARAMDRAVEIVAQRWLK